MSDWDKNSPQLQKNIEEVLEEAAWHAASRKPPTLTDARNWHRLLMRDLKAPNPHYIGLFRGEPGLDGLEVQVGGKLGVMSAGLATELADFEEKLQKMVAALDIRIAPGQALNVQDVVEVIDLCAWAHAEWVRLHPFVNGNGRTARIWANSLAMRYGIPPFIVVRPRPGDSYGKAAAKAMDGNWKPTVSVFRRLYTKYMEDL
jgi:fido (protein-threonine AMPylation protein)